MKTGTLQNLSKYFASGYSIRSRRAKQQVRSTEKISEEFSTARLSARVLRT